MFCTRCGAQNPDEAKFCRNCSITLVKTGSTPSAETLVSPPAGVSDYSSDQPPARVRPPASSQGNSPYPGYQGHQSYQGYQGYHGSQSPPPPPTGAGAGASARAIAAMILSLISVASCGPLMSIPGLIMGKLEMDAINKGQAPQAGLTFAKIGFYAGIGLTLLYCLVGIVYAFVIAAAIKSGVPQ